MVGLLLVGLLLVRLLLVRLLLVRLLFVGLLLVRLGRLRIVIRVSHFHLLCILLVLDILGSLGGRLLLSWAPSAEISVTPLLLFFNNDLLLVVGLVGFQLLLITKLLVTHLGGVILTRVVHLLLVPTVSRVTILLGLRLVKILLGVVCLLVVWLLIVGLLLIRVVCLLIVGLLVSGLVILLIGLVILLIGLVILLGVLVVTLVVLVTGSGSWFFSTSDEIGVTHSFILLGHRSLVSVLFRTVIVSHVEVVLSNNGRLNRSLFLGPVKVL